MAHPRKLARNFVAAALNGNTTLTNAGWTFEASRARDIDDDALPVAWVYTDGERVVQQTEHRSTGTPKQRVEMRECRLVIVMQARGNKGSDVEDGLDDAIEEVEATIMADTTQGGNVEETEYNDYDSLRDASGIAVFGFAVITYHMTYLRRITVDGG